MGSIFSGSLLITVQYAGSSYGGTARIDFTVNLSSSTYSKGTVIYNTTGFPITTMYRSLDGTYKYIMFKYNPTYLMVLHAVVIGLVGSTGTTGGTPLNPVFVTPTTTSSTSPPGSGSETITLAQGFDLNAALLALPVVN
jgi:hypothetical protein